MALADQAAGVTLRADIATGGNVLQRHLRVARELDDARKSGRELVAGDLRGATKPDVGEAQAGGRAAGVDDPDHATGPLVSAHGCVDGGVGERQARVAVRLDAADQATQAMSAVALNPADR